MVAVSLLVAPSYLRPWLEQRAAIAAEREKIATLEGEIRQMEAEKRRWDDPAYVRSQARSRLNMVMPGETAYRYMDDDAHQPIDPRSAASETSHEDPWYTRVWDSVKQAGG